MPVDLDEQKAADILFGAPGSHPVKPSKFLGLSMTDDEDHSRPFEPGAHLQVPDRPFLEPPLNIELPEDARQLIMQQHAAIDASHEHATALLDGIIEQCQNTKAAMENQRTAAKRHVTTYFMTAHAAAATARPTEHLINQLAAPALEQALKGNPSDS